MLFRFFILGLLIINNCNAQSLDNDLINNQLPVEEEWNEQDEQVLEKVQYFLDHPINLNKANASNLKTSGMFSDVQINSILNHIRITGKIIEIYELQTLDEFSIEQLLYLSNYCLQLTETPVIDKQLTIINRVTYKSTKNIYPGSDYGIYQKISYKNTLVNFAVVRENDIGEKIKYSNVLYPFDHFAGYIQFANKSNNIIIGNFRSFFGQGLLIGNGKGTEFAADWTTLVASNSGFHPYASAMEMNYFQGVAITKIIKKINFNIAQSLQKIDDGTITGYHRTKSELAKKNKTLENITIINVAYQNRKWKIGNSYLIDLINQKIGISNDFIWRNKNYLSAFEIANFSNSWAFQGSVMISLNQKAQLGLALNSFSKKYNAAFSSNQLLNGNTNNDQGLSIAFKYLLKKKGYLQLKAITHQYNASHSIINIPSYKQTFQLVYLFHLKQSTEQKVLISYQSTFVKTEFNETNLDTYQLQKLISSYVSNKQNLSEDIILFTRVDYKFILNEGFPSYAIQSYLRTKIKTLKSDLIYGISLYNCNYKTRIFSNEKNIPTVMSIQQLIGKGNRAYLIIQKKIWKHTVVNLKASSNKIIYEDPKYEFQFQLNINL